MYLRRSLCAGPCGREVEVLGGDVNVISGGKGDIGAEPVGVVGLTVLGGGDVGAGVAEGVHEGGEEAEGGWQGAGGVGSEGGRGGGVAAVVQEERGVADGFLD